MGRHWLCLQPQPSWDAEGAPEESYPTESMRFDRRGDRVGVRKTGGRNLVVDVEGVDLRYQKAARKELLSAFSGLARDLRDVPIRVWVPKDFDGAVTEAQRGARDSEVRFVARQRHHAVGGIVVPAPSSGGLSFVILFGPSAFGRGREAARWRLHMYAHEATHVVDDLWRHAQVGNERFFGTPTTVRDLFLTWAHVMTSEYRAERRAVNADAGFRHDRRALARANSVRFERDVEGLVSALKELPAWLTWIVGAVPTRVMTFTEFFRSVAERITEVLRTAAYTSARSDVLSRGFSSLIELQGQPKYDFFFETWDKVWPKLRSLASSSAGYDEGRLWEVAELLIGFYDACGIHFRDGPDGIRVGVSVPRFGRPDPGYLGS